jgi:CO/xanthine dehydrogenase FAD-binding subunit
MVYLRRLPRFEYVGPATLAEVCALTADAAGGEVMLLAGGTDAILQMRRRERTPRCVVGLKRVEELDFVRERPDGGLAVGATTTLQSLLSAPAVRKRYDVLSETAAQIGGRELRNVATVGGNVAGALPCADLPPALMTLDAKVKLSSLRGDRSVPLEAFYPEYGRTVAASDELLSEISLPPPMPGGAGAYLKFHDRHSMDMTVVGVAAFVVRDDDGRTMREVRLAYATSAPTVFRARRAEAALCGARPTEEALEAAAEIACREASPRSSWRANRDYRLELIKVLTKRAIRQGWRKSASREGEES